RKSDRESLPIVNLKDQELFSSWDSVFGDNGGKMRDGVPLYSFDGRDILRDSAWSVLLHCHPLFRDCAPMSADTTIGL
ncbi:hypothetical protein CRUP_009900, partial [Coryphaenoides rupestris]